ncbi:MAG: hypothetical protein FWD12_13050 [Alphaproteobacteria bacterium]|nr:hypothetical protein [Alphaproteobacteria bacterium]
MFAGAANCSRRVRTHVNADHDRARSAPLPVSDGAKAGSGAIKATRALREFGGSDVAHLYFAARCFEK